MPDSPAWLELREMLEGPRDPLGFRAICAALDTWRGDDREAAIALAAQALEGWPDEAREAPWSWLLAAEELRERAGGRLARTVRADPHARSHAHGASFRAFAGAGAWGAIRRLEGCIGADALLAHADGWPAVRGLHGVQLDPGDVCCEGGGDDEGDLAEMAAQLDAGAREGEAPLDAWPRVTARFDASGGPGAAGKQPPGEALLASPLLRGLESLDITVGFRSAPSLPQELPALRSLGVSVSPPRSDAAGLLRAEKLPALEELTLGTHHLFGDYRELPEGLAGAIDAAARFESLRRLTLRSIPAASSRTFFERFRGRLERLAFDHRFPRHPDGFERGRAWLTPEVVGALRASGSARSLTHLTVWGDGGGAAILDLLEDVAPGALVHLDLVGAGLEPEHIARLAAMPQLSGVRTLDLRENALERREGEDALARVRALARSPHLGSLRELRVGRILHEPYCQGPQEPFPMFDEGLAALAAAPWLRGLETLKATCCAIGPDGLRALGRVEMPRLAALDLSFNRLEREGAEVLARLPLARGLRSLALDLCVLEDDAAAALAAAPFEALRSLSLAQNAIGLRGVEALAGSRGLRTLLRLDLADNVFAGDGIAALARSPHLGRLVEVATIQGSRNYRACWGYDDAAAEALAGSATLARLDALIGGTQDLYMGGLACHPFDRTGIAAIRAASGLRPELRASVAAGRPYDRTRGDAAGEPPREPDPDELPDHRTPEEIEEDRRAHDFRFDEWFPS